MPNGAGTTLRCSRTTAQFGGVGWTEDRRLARVRALGAFEVDPLPHWGPLRWVHKFHLPGQVQYTSPEGRGGLRQGMQEGAA